jgi:hypothetical protein
MSEGIELPLVQANGDTLDNPDGFIRTHAFLFGKAQ